MDDNLYVTTNFYGYYGLLIHFSQTIWGRHETWFVDEKSFWVFFFWKLVKKTILLSNRPQHRQSLSISNYFNTSAYKCMNNLIMWCQPIWHGEYGLWSIFHLWFLNWYFAHYIYSLLNVIVIGAECCKTWIERNRRRMIFLLFRIHFQYATGKQEKGLSSGRFYATIVENLNSIRCL